VVIFLVLVCCTEKSGNPGEDSASLPQKKIMLEKATTGFRKSSNVDPTQGCQMVYFHTKIPILVRFGEPWNGKFWNILMPFGTVCSQ
jgi:hypothetical protein